jgi:hypothetical protein
VSGKILLLTVFRLGKDEAMNGAEIFRLQDFEAEDRDVLLIVATRDALRWLSEHFRDLASSADDIAGSIIIGSGYPSFSSHGIEIKIYLARNEVDNELVESDTNKFCWRIGRKTAKAFEGLIGGLTSENDPIDRHEASKIAGVRGGHNYLDPSNTPPAPIMIVSLDEYSPEDLVKLRSVPTNFNKER